MGKKQPKVATSTINALVQDACSGLEELGSELREWYENMPENLQGNRSDVDDAASTLENISAPDDAPEVIREIEVSYNLELERLTSRRARGGQLCYEMDAAIQEAEYWLEENPEHADREAVETWIDEVSQVKDEAEGVEYPGRNA